MKWFKHLSGASRDQGVVLLEAEFGLEGYARWFKLLESIADQMNETDNCGLTLPWSEWEHLLRGRRQKLQQFFDYIASNLGVKLVATGKLLTVTIPNLLKIRDNHTTNKRKTCKQDVEVDVDIRKVPVHARLEPEPEPDLKIEPSQANSDDVELVLSEQEIIDLYVQKLPDNPPPRPHSKFRLSNIKTLQTTMEFDTREEWVGYFNFVAKKCPLLTGQVPGKDGKPPFKAELDWLLKRENVIDIGNHKYTKGVKQVG